MDALKLLDKGLARAGYLQVSQYLPTDYLFITKGKEWLRWRSLVDTALMSDQHANNETNWHRRQTDIARSLMWGLGRATIAWVVPAPSAHPNSGHGKHQTNVNWEKFYKTLSLYFSKTSTSRKTKKVEDLFHIKGDKSNVRVTCNK